MMNQEEAESLTLCLDCGELVDTSPGRAYGLPGHGFLCRACAARRGGAYDDIQDRWHADPDVSDLVAQQLPEA